MRVRALSCGLALIALTACESTGSGYGYGGSSVSVGYYHGSGWYPDVERAGGERWWDGHAWTEYRRPASAAPPGAPGPPTAAWVTPAGQVGAQRRRAGRGCRGTVGTGRGWAGGGRAIGRVGLGGRLYPGGGSIGWVGRGGRLTGGGGGR